MASCRIERKIYSPLPVNTPTLHKKKDFSASATFSAPTGFDFNGGFALTNRLALIAGAYTHKNRDIETRQGFTSQEDSSNLTYRHKGFTFGAGAFFPLSKKSHETFFSFYGGINTGSFNMKEEFYRINPPPTSGPVFNNYNSRLNRYFLQGSLNYYGEPGEASLTFRYNFVEYKKITTDYTDNQLSQFRLPPFVTKPVNSFLDMALDFKVYLSRDPVIGVQFFGVFSGRTNDWDDMGTTSYYYYYPYRFGTGIFFRSGSGKVTSK
jgi:hypothetical protein